MNIVVISRAFAENIGHHFPHLKSGPYTGELGELELGYRLVKATLNRERSNRFVGLYTFEVFCQVHDPLLASELGDQLLNVLETLEMESTVVRASGLIWETTNEGHKATATYSLQSLRPVEEEVKMTHMKTGSLHP